MGNKQHLFLWCLILFAVQACGINSNLMFKTPKGAKEISDSIPLKPTAALLSAVTPPGKVSAAALFL